MKKRLKAGEFLSQYGHILGICPCCGELFRLTDARPYLRSKPAIPALDKIEEDEQRLVHAEQHLDEVEDELWKRAKAVGERAAKKQLKQIDLTFSGCGIDPQDVKVLFDPVEYIVFDGMNNGRIRRVVLMARAPTNRYEEKLTRSIDRTVTKGNIEFKTLRILSDGKLELR